MTSERQANQKQSGKWCAELWELARGWDKQRGTEGRRRNKVTNLERELVRSKDRVITLI